MSKRLEDMTEPELAEAMRTMAIGVEAAAEQVEIEQPLFVLLVFNDPKFGNYISNCQKEDVIQALREAADRLERCEDVQREP